MYGNGISETACVLLRVDDTRPPPYTLAHIHCKSDIPGNGIMVYYEFRVLNEKTIKTGIAFVSREALHIKPDEFALFQNTPNPFNSSTTIEYQIPQGGNLYLAVYNVYGQIVTVLSDGIVETGNHSVKWNAEDMPSGIYFYQLKADGFTATRKMLLLK